MGCRMGKMIKSFTDLEIWQLALELTLLVYKETVGFPKGEQFGVTSQIRRSISSVGANIAEGFGRFHYKEFIKFLLNARGSLQETKHWLILSKELGYTTERVTIELINKIERLNVKLNNTITVTEKQMVKEGNK